MTMPQAPSGQFAETRPGTEQRHGATSAVLLGPLPAGAVIGHYRAVEHLGSGGMGHIHRALDLRLEREVAIKVASRRSDSPELALKEARALAALNHPNVVTVHELDVHDGHPYLVMELLRGETVRARMERTPPSLEEALRWMCDTLRGMAAAHQAGVVHLDLKPENLFLTTEGVLKILDFGIADLVRGNGATSTRRALGGTASYMAPEQAGGEQVDFRADLFSFGIILCELTTGVHPFESAGAPKDREQPLPDLPWPDPELGAIARACLARDPLDRPASALHLLERLEAVARAHTLEGVLREETFVETDHGQVAYRCFGQPRGADILLVPGLLSRFDLFAQEPEGRAFLRALAEVGRVILFDRCGFGASDRVSDTALPQLDDEVQYLEALLDAAGSRRTVLYAIGEGALPAILFAALHPERVAGLVLHGGAARFDALGASRLVAWTRTGSWGRSSEGAASLAPSFAAEPRLARWLASWERMTANARTARAWARLMAHADVTPALPFVSVPTLALHREGDRHIVPEASVAIALEVEGARREVLPGADHLPWAGGADAVAKVVAFARALPAASTDDGGALSTFAATNLPAASLPARLRGHLIAEQKGGSLLRFGRPGQAARVLLGAFARLPPNAKPRAALACVARRTPQAEVIATLHPLLESARPGSIAATEVTRQLLQKTASIELGAPGGGAAAAASEANSLEEVAPLSQRSHVVSFEPGPRLRIEGSLAPRDPERLLFPHFRRIHQHAVGCGTLDVDLRRLRHINSATLGLFIHWAGWIRAEPEPRRYQLRLIMDPAIMWQRANLPPLELLAPEVMRVCESVE